MTAITAEMIKNLRESTGAGMMDCKKALTETNGNMEDAVDWLRKKGLSAAAKKSGRVAAESRDDLVVRREPRIEVAAAPARGRGEPHRIDEVRALLERLDGPAARGQRRREADADRGLARRLVRRRDEEAERRFGGDHRATGAAAGAAGRSSCGRKRSTRTPTTVIRNATASPPAPRTTSGRLGAYEAIAPSPKVLDVA